MATTSDPEPDVGIAVGFVTCGEIGFGGRTDYTAIGTIANLAARICGVAADGQTLVWPDRVQVMDPS